MLFTTFYESITISIYVFQFFSIKNFYSISFQRTHLCRGKKKAAAGPTIQRRLGPEPPLFQAHPQMGPGRLQPATPSFVGAKPIWVTWYSLIIKLMQGSWLFETVFLYININFHMYPIHTL